MAGPLGSTPGIIVGTGVGIAAATALDPAVERSKQQAWKANPFRILDPSLLARLHAQGGVSLAEARAEAELDGYSADKLDALVYLAQTVPAIAEALSLWRRDLISDELWEHVLVKNGLDARYLPALDALKESEPLDPAVIAIAIVRGIMDDPGFLPVGPPSGQGKVEPFPKSSLDTLKEAAQSGDNRERLFVKTAISGRPMGPESAAAAVFREIIERIDYDRAIAEGDVRNEWADAIFETARQIPTSHDGVEGRLRGWLTDAEMYEQTARHGMSRADTDLLFKINGRPPSWHQIWIGLQRGGTYDGPINDIHPAFLKGLQESNLRPEWYNLLWHSRYNYPSPFVLRQLTTSKAITEADAEEVLKFEGYEPAFAKKIATAWAGGTAAAADPHVAKAQTQLWTTAHRSYIDGEADTAEAEQALERLGIDPASRATIIGLWDHERELRRKQLTSKEIKKLYQEAKWTESEAVDRLVSMGYSTDDALNLLKE